LDTFNKSFKDSLYLWLFSLLFVLLGLGYSTLTPVFENSDETLHYPYVKHLADGRGLPLATPGQLWQQEGSQPPLYYALVAATTFWIDTGNLLDQLQPNPHWLFSEVRAVINDNQNVVLHGPPDAFPYHQTALAVHIGRWWSLAFGLATVICTFLLARQLFPDHPAIAVTATALVALTPQFLRVSATVSNDSLAAALTSLTVLLALKFTEPGRLVGDRLKPQLQSTGEREARLQPERVASLWPPLLLGLLAGLALLTKLSSLTTAILAAVVIFWRLFFISELHQKPFQKMVQWLLIAGLLVVALTGWWFYRNYRLYGEWLATETHLNLAGRSDLSPAEVWGLRAEAERAYWATFGWGQIRPPEWIYRLLGGFSRIGLIVLVLALSAKLIQGDRRRPLPLNLSAISVEKTLFLLFWAGLNLALYIRWVMEVGSVSHTRLIFPAISAISLLLALGWHALLPRRLGGWFSGLLAFSLLSLNLYSLGWLIYPAFRPNEQIVPAGNEATPVEVTFLDSLRLSAGQVYPGLEPSDGDPPGRRVATPGDIVTISAHWQVLAPLAENYSVAALLLAPDGTVLARRETYPGLGLRPTRFLTPGQTFVDLYPLKLSQPIDQPIVAQAVVSLFDVRSEMRAGFPALAADGREVTPVAGQIKLVPENWPEYRPSHSASVNFASAIALTGYDLGPNLTLYWRALAPVEENYTLFIHLLDAEGKVVAQADAPPTHNAYPTSWWAAGETIADTHPLPDSPQATHLRLGLYSLSSGRRLSVTASSLPSRDNSVELPLP
jgi:hypothetical protein